MGGEETSGMSGGQQRQVTRWSYRLPSTEDGDEEAIEEQEADTRQALYQYVFHRADRDAQLSRVETVCFKEAATRLEDEGGQARERCVCVCVFWEMT